MEPSIRLVVYKSQQLQSLECLDNGCSAQVEFFCKVSVCDSSGLALVPCYIAGAGSPDKRLVHCLRVVLFSFPSYSWPSGTSASVRSGFSLWYTYPINIAIKYQIAFSAALSVDITEMQFYTRLTSVPTDVRASKST